MKKKNDMARECAEQLKPFGKTIKDATDFYLRHLTRKKSTGRREGSGVLSGITPSMEWSDIRNRTARDRFKTKVIYLLEMAMWRTPAKPKHTTDQQGPQTNDELRKPRQAEQAHIMSKAEMERWRQKRDAAAKAYERLLKHNPVPDDLQGDECKQEIKKRFDKFLLTPAGKFTDAMASDIYRDLEKRELQNGHLMAEDRQFTSKERVMDAIHDLATQLQFALRKQH
jgi:hypothetical protein